MDVIKWRRLMMTANREQLKVKDEETLNGLRLFGLKELNRRITTT